MQSFTSYMRIDAVGVVSKDIKKTIQFYTHLGFEFEKVKKSEDHIEAKTKNGEVRLMVDFVKLFKDLTGKEPRPGNTSSFAVLYDTSREVDEVIKEIKSADFTVVEEPFNAPWGQRYAMVEDPDGFRVDLFAVL